MKLWEPLEDELAKWQDSALPARLWLRDDDAIEPTEPLCRLAGMAEAYQVPVTIAVIPQPAGKALAAQLAGQPLFSVALHGTAHTNHAPRSEKKCELGLHRGLKTVVDELAAGHAKLRDLFGDRYIHMLVPPWNRIDAALVPELPNLGLSSLSTFTWQNFSTMSGLAQLNTHVDIIDWKQGRIARPAAELIDELAKNLAIARTRACNGERPAAVGILTHHLVHDEAAWHFLAKLFAFAAGRADIKWCQAASLVPDAIS